MTFQWSFCFFKVQRWSPTWLLINFLRAPGIISVWTRVVLCCLGICQLRWIIYHLEHPKANPQNIPMWPMCIHLSWFFTPQVLQARWSWGTLVFTTWVPTILPRHHQILEYLYIPVCRCFIPRFVHPAIYRTQLSQFRCVSKYWAQDWLACPVLLYIPSGNLTVCYWKWPFIVNVPIKHGDFP